MVKTPEEYFSEQCFEELAPDSGQTGLSDAEHAFVQKYLGSEVLAALPVLGEEPAVEFGPQTQKPAPRRLKEQLRQEDRVQLVSFFVNDQIFLLPVEGIQEVLRYMRPTRLPLVPDFVAGVVNLRGRVTPLIYLDALLDDASEHVYTEKSFVIVCNAMSMQVGLIIDKVQTMHFVPQELISWNKETQSGVSSEFLYGVADINGHLSGILAPELIVENLLSP